MQLGRLPVNPLCFRESDAELVLAQAGGDVGVRFGVDIRIDAQRHLGLASDLGRQLPQQPQFAVGFAVESADLLFERVAQFFAGLADAGKYDARRVSARLQHAVELAAGHNVEPGAFLREKRQNPRDEFAFTA